jgi:hypothetical protein
MAYQHKHILTREIIVKDLTPDTKGERLLATIMMCISLLGASVATLFIYLIVPMGFNVSERSLGIHIAAGVVWVIAAAIMILFGRVIVHSYKPPQIPDFYVSKRRLDTVAPEEYQYTSYTGGRAHAVYRDVLYFEGMDKYFPSPTQMELAEEGDMYYVVTSVEGGTTPLRIYRADAYIWQE